ncbi:MAG: hypothetical protein M1820_009328 [Bogoriella megaspora]|nr:MAG: hypothetical protein M1820_009328 [Bogoriella megaspora]
MKFPFASFLVLIVSAAVPIVGSPTTLPGPPTNSNRPSNIIHPNDTPKVLGIPIRPKPGRTIVLRGFMPILELAANGTLTKRDAQLFPEPYIDWLNSNRSLESPWYRDAFDGIGNTEHGENSHPPAQWPEDDGSNDLIVKGDINDLPYETPEGIVKRTVGLIKRALGLEKRTFCDFCRKAYIAVCAEMMWFPQCTECFSHVPTCYRPDDVIAPEFNSG